jgi:PAS domain S-box-containing protein
MDDSSKMPRPEKVERRQAETMSLGADAHFRLLVEGINDYAIYLLDPEGRVVTWNRGAERIKGYKREEVVGKHFSLFYPKEAIEQGWPEQALEIASTDDLFKKEGWQVRKDGSRFWAAVVIAALRDETGNLTGFSKTACEVTGRRQGEEKFRGLLESAPDAMVIVAGDGAIVLVNTQTERLFGYNREELIGQPVEVLIPQPMRAKHVQQRNDYFANPLVRPMGSKLELYGIRQDGSQFPVEISLGPLEAEEGLLVSAAIRDVSERKRIEQALKDADRRKDEFLAMLSHELRNPLAPILNALQVLQLEKGESPHQQKAQAIIERQVGQLTHLVDDLLDVSRTVTGRIQLRREQIAAKDIVERAVETVRPLIDERKHELTVSLPPDSICLYADAARMEQVVTNLLTNAAKYTNEGGHIWLSVQQEGDKAVLRVRDTGLGISPAFLPHVFDLFTQAERTSDRLQGGLGIGLALVKRLVEMHEGTIGVSSALGQGSEFVVSLPAILAVPLASKRHSPASEIAKPNSAALRVLVVDDNVDAAMALEMLLTASGHKVRVAHTGPTGIAAALDFRPNVMLLDIGLPELNGWKVAKQIRQEFLQDIVLVAMTGYGQNRDRQRSRRAGFDHHLVKPVDFGKLRQILAAVSEKAAVATEWV